MTGFYKTIVIILFVDFVYRVLRYGAGDVISLIRAIKNALK